MITPKEHAMALDLKSLIAGNNFVRVFSVPVVLILLPRRRRRTRDKPRANFAPSQVHRVDITDSNVHSWTSESPLTQALGLELEGGRPGGARPGDVVWLAQR